MVCLALSKILARRGVVALLAAAMSTPVRAQEPPSASTNPSGTVQLRGCIVDQYGTPYPNQQVTFSATVNEGSGFHYHMGSNRPTGSVWPSSGITDGSGCATTTFYAPAVSGTHQVYGNTNIGESYAVVYVILQTPYLNALPPYPDYVLVGATNDHPTNHYGTVTAAYGLQQIAAAFRQQTGLQIAINDMSLPWGGIFDLGPNYGGTWWNLAPPCKHCEHQYGTNADIRASSLGNYTNLFLSLAHQYGGDAGGPIVPEGDHYHLRFAN